MWSLLMAESHQEEETATIQSIASSQNIESVGIGEVHDDICS